MMGKHRKKWRLLLVPLFLWGIWSGGSWLSGKFDEVKLHLPKQISVENYMKVEVRPLKYRPDQWIQFEILLESPQNRGAVATDLMKVCLLVDDKNMPYSPIKWKTKSTTDSSRVGILTFPLSGTPKTIKLSIFDFEERIFLWESLK